MVYRYEFVPPDPSEDLHQGILTALEGIVPDIWELSTAWAYFEDMLDEPTCDMRNTISYFTEAGNRKFRKAIRKLCKDIEASGKGTTRCIKIESISQDDILYEDKYQIVTLRGNIK